MNLSPRYAALYAFGLLAILIIPGVLFFLKGKTWGLSAFGFGIAAYLVIDAGITFFKHRDKFRTE